MTAVGGSATPFPGPSAAGAAKQVRLRWFAIGAAFAWVCVLFGTMTLFHGGTSQISSGSPGGPTSTTTTSLSLYDVDPTPVLVICGALLGACLIGVSSLRYRVRRGSAKVGVTALVTAGACGVLALLALLSVGVFIVPLVVLLVVVSLPLDRQRGRLTT